MPDKGGQTMTKAQTVDFREIARSLAALLGVNDPNEANPAEAARVAGLWHAQLFPEEAAGSEPTRTYIVEASDVLEEVRQWTVTVPDIPEEHPEDLAQEACEEMQPHKTRKVYAEAQTEWTFKEVTNAQKD
jgi:hypothetical protein